MNVIPILFLSALTLLCVIEGKEDFSAFPDFDIPEIRYSDLLALNELTVQNTISHLTSIGSIQITGIPDFDKARNSALQDAADCLLNEANVERKIMDDGSIRLSSGAATVDEVKGPMDNRCGERANSLRALVDATCRQLFFAFDSKLKKKKNSELIMEPSYHTFSQLMEEGSSLEHLHSYYPAKTSSPSSVTMNFHTDAGLMIAMTTGYYSNGFPSPQSGLYLSIPDDRDKDKERRVKAKMADDALIIMMGEGAQNWLAPVLAGRPFRPIPHALVVDLDPASQIQNSRSWFGRMYLPPMKAILPTEQIPYSQLRQRESDFQSNKYNLPLACGGSLSSKPILQNQPCEKEGVPGVYCWTQCQSVADLPCGQDAVCVDTNTGEIIEDGVNTHCMNKDGSPFCQLECLSSGDTNSSSSDYCYGYGTTMSMTGFFSIAKEGEGSTPCVNLLFDDWTLDSSTKFAFGCLGVFCLGLLIQYMTVLRANTKKISDRLHRRAARVLAFGVQVVLSYFLMLVAMTYNVELFCMVVIGLTVGYALFHSSDETDPTEISADSCCPPEKGYDRLEDDVLTPM